MQAEEDRQIRAGLADGKTGAAALDAAAGVQSDVDHESAAALAAQNGRGESVGASSGVLQAPRSARCLAREQCSGCLAARCELVVPLGGVGGERGGGGVPPYICDCAAAKPTRGRVSQGNWHRILEVALEVSAEAGDAAAVRMRALEVIQAMCRCGTTHSTSCST